MSQIKSQSLIFGEDSAKLMVFLGLIYKFTDNTELIQPFMTALSDISLFVQHLVCVFFVSLHCIQSGKPFLMNVAIYIFLKFILKYTFLKGNKHISNVETELRGITLVKCQAYVLLLKQLTFPANFSKCRKLYYPRGFKSVLTFACHLFPRGTDTQDSEHGIRNKHLGAVTISNPRRGALLGSDQFTKGSVSCLLYSWISRNC